MKPLFTKRRTGHQVLIYSCGALSCISLFMLMGLTFADVGGRIFSRSLPGALELTEILMVFVVFGSLPLVSWNDQHVVFSTFDTFLPPIVRKWQDRIVHLISGLLFALLAWLLYMRGERFFSYGQTTAELEIPVGYVAFIMAALTLVTATVHLVLIFHLLPSFSSGVQKNGGGTHD